MLLNRIIKKIYLFVYKKILINIWAIPFNKFGVNNYIWFPIRIYGKKNVIIGNNCGINSFVHIWGNGGVTIGDNVMIATHVSISSLSHEYNSDSMRFSKIISKRIIIEDDVWIGSNAVILPGITIGKGAVIGAGTIVTKNVPAYAIVIGNPGRIIKYREIKNTGI